MSDWPDYLKVMPMENPPGTSDFHRDRSPFSAPWQTTLRDLSYELDCLDGKNMVLEVDIAPEQFRMDGIPRSSAKVRSAAVVLHLDSRMHGHLRYDADTFDKWKDNIRAIALALKALRAVNRYGISKSGQQYTGWRAIEAAPVPTDELLAELWKLAGEEDDGWDQFTVKELVNHATKMVHPDNPATGGSDTFIRVRAIKAMLEKKGLL